MYAGHFQRFIENFLKMNALDSETTIDDLISFLGNNCRILAYQQLISKLLINHEFIYGSQIYNLLTKILNRAVLAVEFIHDQFNSDLKFGSTIYKNKLYNEDLQPLNLNKRPIPLPEVDYSKREEMIDYKKEAQFKKFLTNSEDKKAVYESIEDAEMETYLIFMTIRSSSYKNANIIHYFRDYEENGYRLIQALFLCGVYCGSKSLISLEAFKLLGIIFNGSVTYSIDGWKMSEEEKSELIFYNSFANAMHFDSKNLTHKMVHALPIFWNHRYNLNEYELSDEEKQVNNTSDYYDDDQKHKRKRSRGETALEILQPFLLSEPPVSSQLAYSCTDIFIQLSRKRRDMIKGSTKNKSDQMVFIDGIILDFYQHHFYFCKDFSDTSFSELLSKNTIIPLNPTDKFYLMKERIMRRTTLNGFLVDFI